MQALPRILFVSVVCLGAIVGCGGGGGSTPNNNNGNSGNSTSGSVIVVDSDGNTSVELNNLEDQLSLYSKDTLDSDEEAGLLLMREEEKLAHDVYTAFANLHGLAIFTNIASSEQTHTAAVKLLLDRYDLTDPAASTATGEFTSEAMQTLYNDLVDMGTPTLVDALVVGVLIEELDISDLEQLRDGLTDNADIDLVYSNLQKGSRNHLRSFYARLVQNGGSYIPVYLSEEEFNQIVNSPTEQGNAGD